MEYKKEFVDVSQFALMEKMRSDSAVLYEISDENGVGSMMVCSVFPGVDIYYNDYRTGHHFSGKFKLNRYFQLSYSHEGVYEVELKNNHFFSIGQGELLAFHNIYESVCSRFPLEVFKGFGITFDLDMIDKCRQNIFKDFSIDINLLINNLCLNNSIFVLRGDVGIRNILEEIYQSDPMKEIPYIRIKVLELLYLLMLDKYIEFRYSRSYYEKKTILKIKAIKDEFLEDLSCRTTLEQMAEKHEISLTMLKTGFKNIYGTSPYEFLRNRRMEYAALLIKQGKYRMNEVAAMVGYQNASKFAGAFRSVIGINPREYAK